jgi:hypothetical protein
MACNEGTTLIPDIYYPTADDKASFCPQCPSGKYFNPDRVDPANSADGCIGDYALVRFCKLRIKQILLSASVVLWKTNSASNVNQESFGFLKLVKVIEQFLFCDLNLTFLSFTGCSSKCYICANSADFCLQCRNAIDEPLPKIANSTGYCVPCPAPLVYKKIGDIPDSTDTYGTCDCPEGFFLNIVERRCDSMTRKLKSCFKRRF